LSHSAKNDLPKSAETAAYECLDVLGTLLMLLQNYLRKVLARSMGTRDMSYRKAIHVPVIDLLDQPVLSGDGFAMGDFLGDGPVGDCCYT
jgi:hypothetical protein